MADFLSAILKPTNVSNNTISPAKEVKAEPDIKQQLGYVNPNTDPNNPFAQIKNPDNSLATNIGLGVRAGAEGVSGLGDIVTTVLKKQLPVAWQKPADALISDDVVTQLTDNILNSIGVPAPLTNTENLVNSAIKTGVQFALPSGEARLPEMVVNALAGGAAGAAQEGVRQSGGSDASQTATGLLVGASGLILGHHIASRFGPNVAKVVEDVSPDKVFDKDGNLTEQGQDIVAKSGTDENTLKQAYEEAVTNTDQHYANIKQAVDNGIAEGLPADHPVVQQAQKMLDDIDAKKAEVEAKINPPEQYQDINAAARTPEQKIQDAQDINVPLTTGQATNDFEQLGKEAKLLSRTDELGNQARDIKENQVESLNQAGDNLKQAFDNLNLDKEQRGQLIQSALSNLKQESYNSVSDLYKQLSRIQNAPKVDTEAFVNHAFDVLDKLPEGDTRQAQLLKELGRYDLIPREYVEQKTFDPIFNQTKLALKNGETVKFKGEQQDLTLANAEKLNQSLNSLYKPNEYNPQIALKKTLHDAMLDTIQKVGNENSEAGKLALQARQAYKEHSAKFNNKDIIQQLSETKEGTDTPKISPDRVVDLVLGPKDNISNVKKLKAMLLSKPETKQAWEVIKLDAMSRLINDSLDTSGNLSATKLNSRIHKMGTAKLKLLFDPSEYNNLMKLNRVAQDVNATGKGMTQPVKNHLINMIYHASKFSLLTLGHGATHIASLVMFGLTDSLEKSKLAKEAKETLEAMRDYKANHNKVSIDDPRLSNDRLKSLLDYTTSKEFIRPLLQGTLANMNDKKDNK